MSDNVQITAGVGSAIATDDIGGVQHQRIKLGLGGDGSATDTPVAADNISIAVPSGGLVWDGSDGVWKKARSAKSIGDSGDGQNVPTAASLLWNGTSYDRARNNVPDQTLLASAARTAIASTGVIRNHNASGLIITLQATSVPASAATLAVYFTLLTHQGINAYATVATFGYDRADGTGNRSMILYPGSSASGAYTGLNNIDKAIALPLTPYFSATVVPSDSQSWTYGLYAALIN